MQDQAKLKWPPTGAKEGTCSVELKVLQKGLNLQGVHSALLSDHGGGGHIQGSGGGGSPLWFTFKVRKIGI